MRPPMGWKPRAPITMMPMMGWPLLALSWMQNEASAFVGNHVWTVVADILVTPDRLQYKCPGQGLPMRVNRRKFAQQHGSTSPFTSQHPQPQPQRKSKTECIGEVRVWEHDYPTARWPRNSSNRLEREGIGPRSDLPLDCEKMLYGWV